MMTLRTSPVRFFSEAPPPLPVGEDRVPVELRERRYEILIEEGLIDRVGEHLRALHPSVTAVILTNSVVKRLYGARVLRSLKAAGLRATLLTVPEGERAKSMKGLAAVLDELIRRRYERKSWLVALGGGVVGDLGGLAASVYLRGLPLVQVPTTLVAQVDASIGGKTAVNHPLGKNLIGTFYQPKSVLIDPQVLATLPARDYRAGLAEVIKYGVIQDLSFFEFLEREMPQVLTHDPPALRRVLRTACAIKAQVVAEDEQEGDRRRILNFGHTVGHAVETVTGYRRYRHGEAVAIGMVVAARLAQRMGLADAEVENRIRTLLARTGLPTELPPGPPAALLRAMRQDKKVSNQRLHFVLPTKIGQVVVVPVQEADLRPLLRPSSEPITR